MSSFYISSLAWDRMCKLSIIHSDLTRTMRNGSTNSQRQRIKNGEDENSQAESSEYISPNGRAARIIPSSPLTSKWIIYSKLVLRLCSVLSGTPAYVICINNKFVLFNTKSIQLTSMSSMKRVERKFYPKFYIYFILMLNFLFRCWFNCL